MATENTERLCKLYLEKFLNNTLNVEDISILLKTSESFPPTGAGEFKINSSEQMQNFVSTIGEELSEERLHQIVRSFIECSYNMLPDMDKNSFLRGTTLEKVLLAFEFARFPKNARAHRQEKLACYVMRVQVDPTEDNALTPLKGKNGYVLYNKTIYYFNEQGSKSAQSEELTPNQLEEITHCFPEQHDEPNIVLEEELQKIASVMRHVQNPLAELNESTFSTIGTRILKPIVEIFQKIPPMYLMNEEMIQNIHEVPEEHHYIYDINKDVLYYQGLFDTKPQVVKIKDEKDPQMILPEKLKKSFQNETMEDWTPRQRFSLSNEDYHTLKSRVWGTDMIGNYIQSYLPKSGISGNHLDCINNITLDQDPLLANKKSSKNTNIACALGVVIGALAGAGSALLITFLSGGFALPVLAIIGIAVGAALVGGLTGGGIGFFASKQGSKKKDDICTEPFKLK